MFTKSTIIAFAAALGAVNASPLLRRQETGVTSLISSAVSSAISSATGAVSGASSAASSAVSSATGAASSAASTATGAASSAVGSATSTGAAAPTTTEAVGTERYPAYPCAPGYLLTYAQVNQTLEGVPVTQAGQAAGEWATSPLFPNVTNATGGTEPGATHTISVMGISINEVLVNATANATSGYAQWTWNSTAPVNAGPVTLDTYQTVFRVYDPDFTTTQEIGNTTFVQIFTNACANDQAAAQPLLETLGSLELGLLGAALSNATAPAATTAAAPASSAAETATSAVESASSAATSAVESATSAVSSAASGAAASATSVASAATSAAAALTSTSA